MVLRMHAPPPHSSNTSADHLQPTNVPHQSATKSLLQSFWRWIWQRVAQQSGTKITVPDTLEMDLKGILNRSPKSPTQSISRQKREVANTAWSPLLHKSTRVFFPSGVSVFVPVTMVSSSTVAAFLKCCSEL